MPTSVPRRLRQRVIAALAVVACLIPGSVPAAVVSADVASGIAVKAALLYNFAKFTQWAQLPRDKPVVLCVVGNDALADVLADAVHGRDVNGHALDVRRPQDSESWRVCQVLFIEASEVRRSAVGLGPLKKTAVLTVSDAEGFAQSDGIVEIYLEAGRMRFAINVAAVERSGLRVNSQLLKVARLTQDRHDQ